MSEEIKKPRRKRDQEGSIFAKKKIVKTARGKEKEVEYFVVRVRMVDHTGQLREKKKTCHSKSEAIDARRRFRAELAAKIAKERDEANNPAPKTFAELVEYFERELLKPAVWRDGQVVAGYRSPVKHIKPKLRLLNEHFGALALKEIGYEDLRRFRDKCINTPVVRRYKEKIPVNKETRPAKSRKKFEYVQRIEVRPRKIATVNRVMAWARHLFNIAIQLDWLDVSPFKRGASLISQAAENERMRILNAEEEARLIEKCSKPVRAHLRPIVVFALETAMRKSEILKLRWKDVDFEQKVIWVEGKNTKTLKPRIVPITARLRVELKKLWLQSGQNREAQVFGIKDFKRSFTTACREAGLENVRFHDLRHTATTRIAAAVGGDTTKAMRITGHTQIKTFMRYNNVDVSIAQSVGAALDEQRSAAAATQEVPSEIPKVLDFRQSVEKKVSSK